MMTILTCAHKKFESTEAYPCASVNFIEFICPRLTSRKASDGFFYSDKK